MANLFHKPIKKELSALLERKPRPKPRPQPVRREPEHEEVKQPPSGAYTDFQIVSTSHRNWKYDVMKFEARGKEVDLTKWNGPVKLNRKDYRPAEDDTQLPVPIELKPMLGPDGKPVVGADGKIVMVGPDGKVPQANGNGSTKLAGKDIKGKAKGKTPFKKKTKQVFMVPEETRKLRREERYPWVMEESGPNGQVWIGHMEYPEKALTHGLLVPHGNQFQFVPAHRWYKFQKRPSYRILALEEAEAEYAKLQKNKDPERWLMRKKSANGAGPSEATLATLKSEAANAGTSSTAADGYALKTVDRDSGSADLFGDEDDEEGKIYQKRRAKDLGGEGDLDEMEYEEEFADDEEKIEQEGDDEEAKEMEERLKRDYRNANKFRDSRVDEDEDEEYEELTGAGKDLRKLVRKSDKNEAYESDDDDKNPYVSEEEETEEPAVPPPLNEPAVINQSQSRPASGATTPTRPSSSQPPRPQKPKNKTLQSPHTPSRANSPGLGNAMVALRATSPKQKVVASGSRAGSPLAGGSRATSPVPAANARTSPGLSSAGSRAGSPPASSAGLKRKAPPDDASPAQTGTATAASGAAPGTPTPDGPKPKKKIKRAEGPLEESMVIAYLREKKDATTKDCILKFQPYFKDEETKKAFTAMVKKVAIFKKNALQLKPEYQ